MALTIHKTKDKVLIRRDDKTYTFSAECNILPHPRLEDYILISEVATAQQENEAGAFKWQDFTNITVTSQQECIELLATDFFTFQKKDVTRFLDTNGDSTGIKEFIGNYSVTSIKALFRPQNGVDEYINRLIVFIADNSSVDAGKYGNGITLTNGIEIKLEKQNGTLVKNITDGIPIKTNADYARFGFQISDISFGSGLNYVHAVLTFEKNGTALKVGADEQLAIYLSDDFTGLNAHSFRAGAYEL